MATCDLRIVFDRDDRTYRGGQQVSGTVHVRANQNVQCQGLRLEHFWQTHGRGNTATGQRQHEILYRGDWRAGETHSYAFRFTAPYGPPTYRGRYLNVDHYVGARVDVPWARDPKRKEEFILLPGNRPYGNRPTSGMTHLGKKGLLKAGAPLGVAMMALGLFFLFPCGLVLIPAGLAVLFYALRNSLAERKIGHVALRFDSLAAAPGSELPLRLTFTPRRSTRLNRIIATLTGQERCVSGSGSNRSTHKHKIHERTFVLSPEGDVVAGRPIQIRSAVPVPQTGAYSFSAKDNSLAWELEVRIDIPLWPDWVEKRTVTVRPALEAELVEPQVAEPQAVEPQVVSVQPVEKPTPAPFVPLVPLAEPERPAAEPEVAPRDVVELPEPADFPADVAEPAAAEAVTDPALVAVIDRLGSVSRYSREREEILQDYAEQSFGCAVEIEKAERTYSYIPDKRFRNGRTVTGVLAGTGHKVSLQLTEARNDEVDALGRGSLVKADCRPIKWNTIYDRLELRQV
ncbi:MAG: vacuolar protein sorting-associated family 26 protein [Planctomycetota bacterium]|jgi:hypothetical protein